MRVEIISDVVCPWCAIGYYRLKQAARMSNVNLEINWSPFELNPQMPQGGENLREHLAAKYGTTRDGSIRARANITALGAEVGFAFQYFDEMKMYNTFAAHQLISLAGRVNKSTEVAEALFDAYFHGGRAIDDIDVLQDIADEVGLGDVRAELDSQSNARFVRDEQDRWRSRGVGAVPVFVFETGAVLQGAHPVDAFAKIINGEHRS